MPSPKIMQTILDWILPPRCIITGESVDRQGMVSSQIWSQLNFIAAPFCSRCGIPFAYAESQEGNCCGSCLSKPPVYDQARASLVYDDASRPLVLGFKHGDKTHMNQTFARWIVQAAGGLDAFPDDALCVPVPLHYGRLVKRRYNQAGLLASAIARETRIRYAPDLIRRVRATATQGGKNWKERRDNVRGAFVLNQQQKALVQDKDVYLVDDVLTTGATVDACASVLKRAGAKSVHVLALARVVHPGML